MQLFIFWKYFILVLRRKHIETIDSRTLNLRVDSAPPVREIPTESRDHDLKLAQNGCLLASSCTI